MPKSLADQLLDLAMELTKVACATTGEMSSRAFDLSQDCRYLAMKSALRALKDSEDAYVTITNSLNAATAAANKANQDLSEDARKIAAVGDALDLAARLIKVVVGVLAL